jgi:LPXTG-motif cell wall-anchored protein
MLAMLALVSLAAAGCRLDLTAGAELAGNGTGTATLTIRMDDALLTELDDLAIDPTIEITRAAGEAEGWTLERTVDDDQAITLLLVAEVSDPTEIGEVFRDLTRGLSEEDPGLFIDIEVAMTADGAATVDGAVSFRAPRTAGVVVDDEPFGPDADALQALTTEVVVPRLELTLPGTVVGHDGDGLDGRTVTWEVPIDEERSVSAASESPSIYQEPWIWIAIAGVLSMLGALVLWLLRRRRRSTG